MLEGAYGRRISLKGYMESTFVNHVTQKRRKVTENLLYFSSHIALKIWVLSGSWPRSRILNSALWIQDSGSRTHDPEYRFQNPDPLSRIQEAGSRTLDAGSPGFWT